ncbi:MAG: spore cortex biosynthesis protein YabQ [Roseburia sp.]
MVVSGAIGQEAVFLGVSVLLGAGMFLLYDCLRILRRIVPHGTVWIGVEDFLYWLVCTGAVFVMLYFQNDGMVRGYSLGGILVGMLFYYGLLSRFFIRLNVLVWKTVSGFLGKFLSVLFRPFCKITKKVSFFFRKQLKKAFKAVKMGLCKR